MKKMLVWTLSVGCALQAHAWGNEGHRYVADIAWTRLTPATQEGIKDLLGRQSLADIAPYADDYRSQHPETAPWHYVDIPLNQTHYDRDRDCPAAAPPDKDDWHDCAADRISWALQRLKDKSLSKEDHVLALEMLVHLVGDIHQPLHAIGDDRGGNSLRVGFLGSEQCGERQRCNLHGVWDYSMIDRRGMSETKYVAALNAEISEHHWDTVAQENPRVWAEESHRLAAEAWVPNNVMLSREYYDAEIQVVDRQIAVAGIRLARMLNSAFRTAAPAAAPAPSTTPSATAR